MKYTNSFYSHILLLSLIAFLPTLCFVSCSKDEILKNDKTYKLGSIMWKLDEGNGQEIIEQELPEEVFYNTGNTTKTIYITPLEKIKETSCFQSENIETLNKWAGRNVFVSVPSEFSLLSSEYKYFAGGVKAPLFAGEEVKLQPTTEMTEHSDLQPNIRMTYKATVYLKKITATYTARFVEDGEGFDSFEIKGKWTGLFFNNVTENITYNDIK